MALEYVLAATLFFTPATPSSVGTKIPVHTGERAFPTLDQCNNAWQREIINRGPKYSTTPWTFDRIEGKVCEPREAQAAVKDPRIVAQEAAIAEVLAKQKR
ncbi:hypothetical protein D9M72_278060 [compost metagenome]